MTRTIRPAAMLLAAVVLVPIACDGGDRDAVTVDAVTVDTVTADTVTADAVTVDAASRGTISLAAVSGSGAPSGRFSPDGTMFLYPDAGRICVAEIDAPEASRCAEHGSDFDPASVQWSDDGARALIIEDFFLMQREPDITIVDTASMEIRNITDDGVDDVSFASLDGAGADLDMAATWLPDGSIVFLRSDAGFEDVRLMRWAAERGAEEIGRLSMSGNEVIIRPLAPLPDGRLLATVWNRDGESSLVRIDGETAETETVATFDRDVTSVEVVDVDEDGGLALVALTDRIAIGSPGPTLTLVDLVSGERFDALSETAAEIDGEPSQPVLATFTPDDLGVLLVRRATSTTAATDIWHVSITALRNGAAPDDLTVVASLDEVATGRPDRFWNARTPFVWRETGELVGMIDFDQIARVSFTAG